MKRIFIIVTLALLAWAATVVVFRSSIPFPFASPDRVIHGIAPLPWQHRIAAPYAFVWLRGIVGDYAEKSFYFLSFFAFLTLAYYWISSMGYAASEAILSSIWLCFAAVVGFAFNVPDNDPAGVHSWRYLFDVPSAALLIALVWFAQRRMLIAWYVLLAVAMLNRETAVLAIPILAWSVAREKNWIVGAVHAAASVALCVAIKYALMLSYPGDGVVHSSAVASNISQIAGVFRGETWPLTHYAAALAGMIPVAVYGAMKDWRDDFFAFAISSALGFVALFLCGKIAEIRIYLDIAPFLVPMALTGIRKIGVD